MRILRRIVQFGLGLQALVMLGSAFTVLQTLAMLRRTASTEDEIPGYGSAIAIALVGPLFGAIPSIAWWMVWRNKPSARGWALAASTINLFILFIGVCTWVRIGHMRGSPLYIGCGVIGILGLVAFWRGRDVAAPPIASKPLRIAGDGTSKMKDYIAQGVSAAMVWVAIDCWRRWAKFHGLPYPDLIPFLIELEIAVLLTTLAHELGHLWAGWASRKMLRSFHVGPFLWAIRNGRWKFEFNLRKFYGGSVGMVAPDLIHLRSRKAFSLIGGPVASLVMGSICLIATLTAPGHAWQSYWALLSMMANFSLAAFVVNLIPLKPEGHYSDGAQLYQVVTNGPWAQVHFAFAMVSTSTVSAARPRDFDVRVINQAANAVPNGEQGLLLRLFACIHYLETNRIPEAIANMESAEALYGQCKFEKPQDICAEFVFINAFHKRDLAAAERWWHRIEAERKIDCDADYWRARTAVLWLKGERKEAEDNWTRGNILAQALPARGVYETTRSCFEQLRAALDEPLRTSPPRLESLRALAAACDSEESIVPMAQLMI